MKLSKAQAEVLAQAKRRIDIARQLDYPNWLAQTHNIQKSRLDEFVAEEYLKEYWENDKNGITLAHANSKTLYKLAEYGLIEIIEDSNGANYGIDVIKVLNY